MSRSLLILMTLVSACKVNTVPPSNPNSVEKLHNIEPESEQVPRWVHEKPSSTEYYMGVGNAPLYDPDHQANAKLEALDDLASEISISIESTSLLNQVENSGGFQENYQAAIKSTTTQELGSYELVDAWKGNQQYWICYRLNKAEFERRRSETKKNALVLSKNYFQNGLKSEEANNLIQAIHFYAQSIEALSGYLNEKNEVEMESMSVSLAVESYAKIARIMDAFYFDKGIDPIAFNQEEVEKDITLTLRSRVSEKPVWNAPILFQVGSSSFQKATNQQGKVTINITKNQSIQGNLKCSVDPSFLNEYTITHQLFQNHKIASHEVRYSTAVPSFSITSEELNLEKTLTNKIIAPLLSKLLIAQGAKVTKKQEADYIVTIASSSRKGAEVSGLYSSYVDFTISIRNPKGDILYQDSFYDTKGMHTSYEKAGIKAYKSIEMELSEQIRNSLNEKFYSK